MTKAKGIVAQVIKTWARACSLPAASCSSNTSRVPFVRWKSSANGTSTDMMGKTPKVKETMISKEKLQAATTATEEEAASGGYMGWIVTGALTATGFLAYNYSAEDVKKGLERNRQNIPEFVAKGGDEYANWRADMEDYISKFSNPSSDRLLPDLPSPQAQFARTLVLDLDETLIHSEWKRERGWRTFKRPGVDEFLIHMSKFYEIVVYTSQLSTYGEPIMERLDPNGCVPHRLYRDATWYKNGKHFRDLEKLNRDPKRVLYITANVDNCTTPENAISVKPWKMDTNDTALLDLMPFLEMVVRTQLPDVRQVVDSYKGTDIPSEFRARTTEMQKKLRERSKQPRLFGSSRN